MEQGSHRGDNHECIFETILEEFSKQGIDVEKEGLKLIDDLEQTEHNVTRPNNEWIWEENLFTSGELGKEAEEHPERELLEIERVELLRMEQEGRLALLSKTQKRLSQNYMEDEKEWHSPKLKPSGSLSPRKTKRIDKTRPFRLV